MRRAGTRTTVSAAFTALLVALVPGLPLRAADYGAYIELLRSDDPFTRQEALETLTREEDALEEVVPRLQEPDRLTRLRLLSVFDDLIDEFLSEVEKEYQALWYDLREIAIHRGRQASIEAGRRLIELIEAEKGRDATIDEKLSTLLRLEELESLARSSRPGTKGSLAEDLQATLEILRAKRERWREEDPSFDERIKPLLELARSHDVSVGSSELTELEAMRLRELEERVAQRQPRLDALLARLDGLGLPTLNRLVARRDGSPEYLVDFYDSILATKLAAKPPELTPAESDDATFEVLRYTRALLWAWSLDHDVSDPRLEELLERHLKATVSELDDVLTIARIRASGELYVLDDRGTRALAAAAESSGAAGTYGRFLLNLLHWRIRPETYRSTGIDFHDFELLPFRERRQRLFDYARVAGSAAIPTLRAVVRSDDLESSFFVKLAAAKALAGLRDLSGYDFLRESHPDMTMKKPEVSRDLLIIQGYELIREKQYHEAIEELQKVLDEYPFDFRANYHIAFAYLLIKSYAKSIHHFEIARRIDPEDQLTLYNLACAYALSGNAPDALGALEASVENGFNDVAHIEKDPDLDSLRDEQRYKDLIGRLKDD